MDERRDVAVNLHAVDRLRECRPAVYGDLTVAQVAKIIRREVTLAIDEGRISSEKPIAFRLHGHKKALRDGNQRVVWTAGSSFAWIVAREGAVDVVITTLTRVSAA